MSRILPHPVMAAVLLIVWVLLMDSLAPGVVLLGVILSLLLTHWSANFWASQPRFHRVGVLLRFIPLVLWDIVVANLNVARLILGSNSKLRPHFLEVPLDLSDPYAKVVLASVITLTPGTVSAEFSEDRQTLLVHALNIADPDEEIRQIKTRYEAPLKEIFECSTSR